MAEKKKEEKAVVSKETQSASSKEKFIANQLKVLNMQNTATAQRNIERVLRNNRKEKK